MEELRENPRPQQEWFFSSNYSAAGPSFAAALQNKVENSQKPQTRQVAVATQSIGVQVQETGQSVQAPSVKHLPLDSMFRVVTTVQQFMTEFNGPVSEEAKIV
jgi:hypothetical protein